MLLAACVGRGGPIPVAVRQLRDDRAIGDPGHGGPHRLHGRSPNWSTGRAPGSSSSSPSTRSASTTSPRRWPSGAGPGATSASSRSTSPAPRRARRWPLTSVRDLYASGGPPELAGGDFGAEAHRLGTMTARMHLGLDKAFGRRPGDVGPGPTASRRRCARVPARARASRRRGAARRAARPAGPCPAIRTHGDFHLGRTRRTEQGWYVVDFATGGRPTSWPAPSTGPDRRRARLPVAAGRRGRHAVVARRTWPTSAADERDPTGRDGLSELAEAWEARNRRAFLAGYLGVRRASAASCPPGREAVRIAGDASFELGAGPPATRPGSTDDRPERPRCASGSSPAGATAPGSTR